MVRRIRTFPLQSSTSPPGPALNPVHGTSFSSAGKTTVDQGDTIEDAAAPVIRPAVPAIVIQGTPPGTQIFVDDHWSPPQIRLVRPAFRRSPPANITCDLRVNGYRDYDQEVDVQTGKTSTINAKLDPLDLPALSEPAKPPVLAVDNCDSCASYPDPTAPSRFRAGSHPQSP